LMLLILISDFRRSISDWRPEVFSRAIRNRRSQIKNY
jgi:hypothetical protein